MRTQGTAAVWEVLISCLLTEGTLTSLLPLAVSWHYPFPRQMPHQLFLNSESQMYTCFSIPADPLSSRFRFFCVCLVPCSTIQANTQPHSSRWAWDCYVHNIAVMPLTPILLWDAVASVIGEWQRGKRAFSGSLCQGVDPGWLTLGWTRQLATPHTDG